MTYPLIDRQLLADFRLVHGGFNLCVLLLFFYQAKLGLSIRRARKAGATLPFPAIKRHRSMGPILALLGVLGFCAGIALVLLNTGNILEFPPHLFGGIGIVALLGITFAFSRSIKGPESPFRTPHFIIGIVLLCLYLLEALLGLSVLL
jgi:hypothetical protein